ncbi:MAG: CinA family protein [Clostridia bacterium]|nr:CinA family protein [Clostridia bacterium]
MENNVFVVRALKEKGLHISFAESCTGGLVAAAAVDVPDASYVLDAAFVTYANSAKMTYVGVKKETLEKFGAVSEETAGEMAAGCAKAAGADIGVSTSGIAGPGGGTPEKPVGTVCFGFYRDGKTETHTRHFPGDRGAVRKAAVEFVYAVLADALKP